MSLSKADLEAIASIVDARIAANVVAPRARQATKGPKDTRTLAQRRDDAVGGSCEVHGKRFATANGYAFHMGNTAHE